MERFEAIDAEGNLAFITRNDTRVILGIFLFFDPMT